MAIPKLWYFSFKKGWEGAWQLGMLKKIVRWIDELESKILSVVETQILTEEKWEAELFLTNFTSITCRSSRLWK